MQEVSTNFLNALRAVTKKLVMVVEIYHQDAVPGANGFDPAVADLIFAFAPVSGVSFRTRAYGRRIVQNGIGSANKTLKKQLSSFNFKLSNSDRNIADFERVEGFEGKICVVRLIDRAASVNLTDSSVVFTGRCDKPAEFDKSSETVSVTAKQILNQTELKVPRRKFTPDDADGRSPSDVNNFEGFRVTQRSGSVQYTEIEKKKVFFGLFTKKKTVTRTLQYSSHSDYEADTSVPLALGRVQMQAISLVSEDTGTKIRGIAVICDGYERGIASYKTVRSITPGFPLSRIDHKHGKPGGVDEQINDEPGWIGAGVYPRTAYLRYEAIGSDVAVNDGAPEIVVLILGLILPVPDAAGNFTAFDWTDNPVFQSRWLLNSQYIFGLAAGWLDDAEFLREGGFCDQVLVDNSNSETVLYNQNQIGIAGVQYQNYVSTAKLSPAYFKNDIDNYAALEADYRFYDNTPVNSDDWTGTGTPQTPPTTYRRRYTSNLLLNEEMNALDFLFDVIFPAFNGYLVQKANGKLAVRAKRPVDFSFVETANATGAAEILVQSVDAWKYNGLGKVLIGATLPTAEVRTVTNYRYKSDVSIPVSATGGASFSGATLTGGTNTTAPNATLTVTNAAGLKTVAIAGFALTYMPQGDDTVVTIAGMLAAQINSHNLLNKFVSAVWTGGATVSVRSKIGFLELNAPLANIHRAALDNPVNPIGLTASSGDLAAGKYRVTYSFVAIEGETLTAPLTEITLTENQKIITGSITLPDRVVAVRWYASLEPNGVRLRRIAENTGASVVINRLPETSDALEPVINSTAAEIHRIQLAFTDKANAASDLTRSNMIKGSFRFPLGGRQNTTNQIKLKYRDASQDFQLTELRVNDKAHIRKVKKTNAKEINGAAIDSYHQARRIANQYLAEWRDGDFFHGWSADGEALLLEEGDVVSITDESGRFVNEPVRIEDVTVSYDDGFPSVAFVARKYRRYYHDDQIEEKLVQLPVVQNSEINRETGAPTIFLSEAATNTKVFVGVTAYSVEAKFRTVQTSATADFALVASETVTDANNQPAKILPSSLTLERATNLSNAEDIYIRVAHSTNGQTFGAWSDVLTATYPNSGGTGGSGGEPPPGSNYAPATISATVSGNSAAVLWTSDTNGGGDWILQTAINGGVFTDLATLGTSVRDYTHTPNPAGVNAVYRIKRANQSQFSNESASIFIPAPPPTAAPPFWTNVYYDEQRRRFDLQWYPQGGTGEFYISISQDGVNFSYFVSAGSTTAQRSAPVPMSQDDEIYYFRIERAGVEGYSDSDPVFVPATLIQQ